MVQLVTSKPADVGTRFRISAQSYEVGFSSHHAQQVENDFFVGTQKSIYFTADEGKKGTAESFSRDKKEGKHRRRTVEKNKKKTPVWPSSWVTSADGSKY